MGNILKLLDLYRYLCFIDYGLQCILEDEYFEYDDLLEDGYNELNKDLSIFNYYLNKN